jgi:hypothetical protein
MACLELGEISTICKRGMCQCRPTQTLLKISILICRLTTLEIRSLAWRFSG